MTKQYDVYAIGNALVDYLAFVSDNFLIENDIKKGIMSLVDTPPQSSVMLPTGKNLVRSSGGSAANTIIGLAVLGGKGCYSGKVGDDEPGRFYRENLSEAGVDFFSGKTDSATGTCLSLISEDAERSMLTFLGASTHLLSKDINEEAVASSNWLYVEGYLWDSDSAREAALRAMEVAQRNSTKIALSSSDPWLVERYRDDLARVSRECVDLIFCNEREAEELTGFQDPHQAAVKLARSSEMVCLTRGENGAIVAVGDVIRDTPQLPVGNVVDTTGAGDLYAAGVLRGLTLGFDLVTSSLVGARAAAAIVAKVGARLDPDDLLK